MKTLLYTTATAIALAATAPASATTTLTFSLTGSDTIPNSAPAAGNFATYTLGSGALATNLRVSAWTMNSNGSISSSFLGKYSTGSGVTSSSDGTGANNLHTADNSNSKKDFLLFQFDRYVDLKGVTVTPFQIGTSTDSDFTYGVGVSNAPMSSTLALNNASVFSGLNFAMTTDTTTSTSARTVSTLSGRGNTFIIGAAFTNADGKIDGIKISGLAVAVPEPATWAMMIAGFGLVGVAVRRRKASLSFA